MIKQADAGSENKERIFHILVEGKYLPMYWMHLEMPAKATLEDLDNFLRAIWVECCDHLSEFRIDKVSYNSPRPDFGDFAMFDAPSDAEGVIVEEDEEFEDDEDDEDDEEDGLTVAEENELIKVMGKELVAEMSAAFPQGLTNVAVDDIIAKFADMALQNGRVSPDVVASPEWQAQVEVIARLLQSGMFELALEMQGFNAEQDMDVRLRKVLYAGTKFSYTYDFGSSTDLSLRVVAEREGVMLKVNDDNDSVIQILSRNEAPVIPCRECGKPATRVVPGYYSVELGALCDTCKLKGDEKDYFSEEEGLLPIVNSPRVGVCGYTGGDNMWEVDDDWDEEEEDEEESE